MAPVSTTDHKIVQTQLVLNKVKMAIYGMRSIFLNEALRDNIVTKNVQLQPKEVCVVCLKNYAKKLLDRRS